MTKSATLTSLALTLVWAVGCAADPVQAPSEEPFPTTIPTPRTDANSRTAHEELLAKTRGGVIDVYFVGDSITRRWGALDYPELLENWSENFFGWNAANFAWGGDRTENILWRLDNGELEGLRPRVFVVQAGTNNLGGQNSDSEQVESIVAGLQAIVERCLAGMPDAIVLLTGVFPRADRPAFNPLIEAINERLEAWSDGERVRYLDINDALAGPDGELLPVMSSDGLHLSRTGYQVWADALKPILRELLGPPASEDRAPPPTGNPEAR